MFTIHVDSHTVGTGKPCAVAEYVPQKRVLIQEGLTLGR